MGTICVLLISSILVYVTAMLAIPFTYQKNVSVQFENNSAEFSQKLNKWTVNEAEDRIYNFCIDNGVIEQLNSGDGQTFTFGDIEKIKEVKSEHIVSIAYDVAFKDIKSGNSLVFFLIDSSGMQNIRQSFWDRIPLITAIVLIASIIAAYLCYRILIKPIIYLSKVSKRLAKLDFTWRCNTRRKDELGVLAVSLESMSRNLQRTLDELKMKSEELEKDIVIIKNMERQRKSFFVAVSHELKTPITIMKAQSENMLYRIGDYANRDKYLQENLLVLDEMEKLVKEIILIAKLDASDIDQPFEQINLEQILVPCVKKILPVANEKKIEIQNNVEDVQICVTKRLFEKALSNVILNAVQYSPAGEKVIIKLEKNCLQVINTGVHIENLEDIFQPLFRVEKSRNKSTGGTGLGLYIVKMILDLHHIYYKIENISEGVMFKMVFDKKSQ